MVYLEALIATLPLLFWFQFKDVPLDRDYAPYCYPAIFKTGYLKDGHFDIKPPLIHWSYKVWLSCISRLNMGLSAKLRLLPAVALSVSILMVGIKNGPGCSLIFAVLLCSPTLWTHMANTEWLTVTLISLALYLAPNPICAVALSLLPFVNQKNLLLLVPVAWALGVFQLPTQELVRFTQIGSLTALIMTSLILWRVGLSKTISNLWLIPKQMGRKRTLAVNTMSAWHLLRPCIYLTSVILACCHPLNPWATVSVLVMVLALLSKQVVPHHFILLALPLAIGADTSIFTFVALAAVFVTRDLIVWMRPSLIYSVTFPSSRGQGDYGDMLAEGRKVAAIVKAITNPDEHIWVNGMENNVYLEAERKAWRIEVPELEGLPEGEAPRVIVHVAGQAKKFDYKGYEPHEISNMGAMTVMVRK